MITCDEHVKSFTFSIQFPNEILNFRSLCSEERQKKRSENQAVINDFGLEESSQHDMKESNSNCIAV